MTTFVAIAALGLFGLPKLPGFGDFAGFNANFKGSSWLLLLLSGLLLVANGGLFFMHARGDYLLLRSAWRPIGTSFLVLALLFPGAWGLMQALNTGPAPIADLGGVVRCLFAGEGWLLTVLLFSSMWKPSAPDTLDIKASLRRARLRLAALFPEKGGPAANLDEIGREELASALSSIAEKSGKAVDRMSVQGDIDYAIKLRDHAEYLKRVIESTPSATLRALRASLDERMQEAVRFLQSGGAR